jgi:hypothetical protein
MSEEALYLDYICNISARAMMRMWVVVLKRKRDSEACRISLFFSPSPLQKAFMYVVSGYLREFIGARGIGGTVISAFVDLSFVNLDRY